MRKYPINIFIISTWSYNEPLTQSYLLPYIKVLREVLPVGSHIHFLTMEKDDFPMNELMRNDIELDFKRQNIHWQTHQYTKFGVLSVFNYFMLILRLCFIVWKRGIRVLHPFAPVAGGIALIVKFITRRKLVLDSWEPHAESMVESGVWEQNSLAFKLLFYAEKKLAKHADYLIAASMGMKDYAYEKWKLMPVRVAYRPACVDLEMFDRAYFENKKSRWVLQLQGKLVAVCTGKLHGMYLGIEVFQFLKSASDFFGEKFHAILLTETPSEVIEAMRAEVNLSSEQLTIRKVSHSEIPIFLHVADFAINPQKPIPSKRYGTPVKDGEYWAMGLPIVIAADISDDSEIVVRENVGVIWSTKKEDNVEVLQQLSMLLQDKNTAERCANAAKKYRSFDLARKAYQEVYASI